MSDEAKPMEVSSESEVKKEDEMKVDTPPASPQISSEAAGETKDEMKVDEPQKEAEPKKEAMVLGIDFGTQKCVAAVSTHDIMFPRIVQNNLANQVTPYVIFIIINNHVTNVSYFRNVLSFREKRRLIGEEALAAVSVYLEHNYNMLHSSFILSCKR